MLVPSVLIFNWDNDVVPDQMMVVDWLHDPMHSNWFKDRV
jgi:hypothetical protein